MLEVTEVPHSQISIKLEYNEIQLGGGRGGGEIHHYVSGAVSFVSNLATDVHTYIHI